MKGLSNVWSAYLEQEVVIMGPLSARHQQGSVRQLETGLPVGYSILAPQIETVVHFRPSGDKVSAAVTCIVEP